MAKLRSVNAPTTLPRSEEEFLRGAPIALPENRNTIPPTESQNTAPPDAEVPAPDAEVPKDLVAVMPNKDLVAVTIRVPRRLRDALVSRAIADQRSIAQTAWRLLAPLLE